MERFVLDPPNFGSNTFYAWEEVPGAAQCPPPHYDWEALGNNDVAPFRSWRLWDPFRAAYKHNQVFAQTDADGRPIFSPARAIIHGIKGEVVIHLSPFQQPNDCETDTNTYYDSLLSMMAAQPLGTTNLLRRNLMDGFLHWPVFVAMYRGTYQAIEEFQDGLEIDSGPPDDPDTLTDVDITNPSTIESSRLIWWDKIDVQLPFGSIHSHPVVDVEGVLVGGTGSIVGTHDHPLSSTSNGQGLYRYPVNLDQNHRLEANQVLWLEVRTGTVRLGWTVDTTPVRRTFVGWPFHAELHATAMATVMR